MSTIEAVAAASEVCGLAEDFAAVSMVGFLDQMYAVASDPWVRSAARVALEEAVKRGLVEDAVAAAVSTLNMVAPNVAQMGSIVARVAEGSGTVKGATVAQAVNTAMLAMSSGASSLTHMAALKATQAIELDIDTLGSTDASASGSSFVTLQYPSSALPLPSPSSFATGADGGGTADQQPPPRYPTSAPRPEAASLSTNGFWRLQPLWREDVWFVILFVLFISVATLFLSHGMQWKRARSSTLISTTGVQPQPTRSTAIKTAPKLYDVFLSHDWCMDECLRDNHVRVGKINKALQNAGLTTWFDHEQMSCCAEVSKQMADGVAASHTVLVFITEQYIQKANGNGPTGALDNCKYELGAAIHCLGIEKIIVAVMEPRCRNTRAWPYGEAQIRLSKKLYIDLADDALFDINITKLVLEIQRLRDMGQANTR
jgi:hypothetical protein